MGIMKVQILCAFTIIVLLQQASQALSEASIQRQLYCDEEWKDDGYCDDENNHEDCDFDGGDCCNNEEDDWDMYCDDCECLEPQPFKPADIYKCMEFNTDYYGNDVEGGKLFGWKGNWQGCAAICAANPECKFFTQSPSGCYLKSSKSGKKHSWRAKSGPIECQKGK